MTWSILARDPAKNEFGVAVATRFFAVGALCPYGDGRRGVLATQALVNPLYGYEGLRLLQHGTPAQDIVAALIAPDAGRDQRQLHVLDAQGHIAAHTGTACVDWCGHVQGDNVSVAGNMLAGEAVVVATRDAWLANTHLPMEERLLSALDAGEAAGGDKRGRQSASIKVYRGQVYPALDIRADDHAYPLEELRRLIAVSHERFVPFSRAMPTHDNPSGIIERALIDGMIAAHQTRARSR